MNDDCLCKENVLWILFVDYRHRRPRILMNGCLFLMEEAKEMNDSYSYNSNELVVLMMANHRHRHCYILSESCILILAVVTEMNVDYL